MESIFLRRLIEQFRKIHEVIYGKQFMESNYSPSVFSALGSTEISSN